MIELFGYHTLRREQTLPGTPDDVFGFFADAGNLEAITPSSLNWLTRIEVWEPGVRFVDQRLRGPYALWHHTHEFEEDPAHPGRTRMRDTVRYAIGFGPLGEIAHALFVRRDLDRIFDFRTDEVLRRI